jgi:sulfur relay (sulfurtransferase) DsrF/TusC family protein
MSEGVFVISTNSKEKDLCIIEKETFQLVPSKVPEKIHVTLVSKLSCNQSWAK